MRRFRIKPSKIVCKFDTWDITLCELIFSFFIVGILTTAGFFIADRMEKSISDSTLKYRQAVQITATNEFKHAVRTQVGPVFVEGRFAAVDPVSVEHLNGEWLSVTEVDERYTKHTQVRLVPTSNGQTTPQTYTYWTWDPIDSRISHAENIVFCGVDMPYSALDYPVMPVEQYTVSLGLNLRRVFTCIPSEMTGVLFGDFCSSNTPAQAKFYGGKTLQSVYESLTTSHAILYFWLAWTVFIIVIVLVFLYIDNNWLESAEHEGKYYDIEVQRRRLR